MPLLEELYKQNIQEKKDIEERVQSEHIRATEEEQKRAKDIIAQVSAEYADKINEVGLANMQDELTQAVRSTCEKQEKDLEARLRLENIVLMTVLGNGPIEAYIQDESVTEIVVQRYDNIVIERAGKVEKVDAVFNNEEHLRIIIDRIVQSCNRQINLMNPIVDARLKDGSRVNATIPPVSPDGATLTIRKFNKKTYTGRDYLSMGSLNNKMLYFLERCVVGRLNIFVSGGTGSGKTTLLNMLSQFIPKNELIVTIEDTLELKLQQPNVRRMEVRSSTSKDMMNVDQQALVRAALRQRPDRIILGEARDSSIIDVLSAMSTGHEGSLCTIHANDPQNVCDMRIPKLYRQEKETPYSTIWMEIAEAIQLIVQISRYPDGSRKISHISSVSGLDESGKVITEDIFIYDRLDKMFKATGNIPNTILEKFHVLDLDFDQSIFEV